MPWTAQTQRNGVAAMVRRRRARTVQQASMASGLRRRPDDDGQPGFIGVHEASPAAWLPVSVDIPDFAYVAPDDIDLHPGINWARTLGARERAPFAATLAEFDAALDRAASKARAKDPEWPSGFDPEKQRVWRERAAELDAHARRVAERELKRQLREAARELASLRAREAELREFLARGGADRM